MSKSKVYYWFLRNLDEATNKVFRLRLPAENAVEDVKCTDGVHNLWKCDREFVSMCEKSRASLGISFIVYVKEGLHGQIRPWSLPASKAVSNTKSSVRMLKRRARLSVH